VRSSSPGRSRPSGRDKTMPAFDRYIGLDYSGAQTPISSLKGLRVYVADRESAPREVLPPPSPRKYWTRHGIAEWLVEQLAEDRQTLVGIDHAFSFPLRYFGTHHLPLDWPTFLDDFQRHWPTDEDHTYVEFVRDGIRGSGAARSGDRRWRRLTEVRAGSAKSVFHFDVEGTVAKSTHAGLPWPPLSTPTGGQQGSFLAPRRMGSTYGPLVGRGGLPGSMESQLRARGTQPGSARRIFGRCMAAARRPRRTPVRVSEPSP
jgi:hypothetical protein